MGLMPMRAAAMLAVFLWSGVLTVAAAEPKTLRLGEMELTYDAQRWRAEPAGDDSLTMQPFGAIGEKLDPVRLARAPTDGIPGCAALARAQLSASLYENPVPTPLQVAVLPAIRFSTHTRCRNATPTGTVICVPHRRSAYLLVASQVGCRGGHNLFSGVDPLGELMQGMRFVR